MDTSWGTVGIIGRGALKLKVPIFAGQGQTRRDALAREQEFQSRSHAPLYSLSPVHLWQPIQESSSDVSLCTRDR
jgi:hypothetical protein